LSGGPGIEILKTVFADGKTEFEALAGLAGRGVDIVAAGDTLRENGLVVVRQMRDISARLIVNVTGMKLRKSGVEALARLARRAGD